MIGENKFKYNMLITPDMLFRYVEKDDDYVIILECIV